MTRILPHRIGGEFIHNTSDSVQSIDNPATESVMAQAYPQCAKLTRYGAKRFC